MRHKRLPLTALRTFEAAIRHCSFKQAAHELGVTPTTVSNQIRHLEAELGCRLFVRKTRQVVPTEVGNTLGATVRTAFGSISDAFELVEREGAFIVNLAVGPILASRWLTPRLTDFRAAHPDIDLRIHHGPRISDAENLNAEMAIDWGHGGWPGLHADKLLSITYAPIVSPALLSQRGALNLVSDLSRFPVIHQKDRSEWKSWLALAGQPDLPIADEIVIEDSNVITQAVMDGQGVALGIFPFVSGDVADGRIVVPFDVFLQPDRAYYLLTRPGAQKGRRVKAVRDWLRAQASSFQA